MAALVPPTPNKAGSLTYAFPARNLLLAERSRKGREERNWVEFMGENGGCFNPLLRLNLQVPHWCSSIFLNPQ